jgi:hypothetical protein
VTTELPECLHLFKNQDFIWPSLSDVKFSLTFSMYNPIKKLPKNLLCSFKDIRPVHILRDVFMRCDVNYFDYDSATLPNDEQKKIRLAVAHEFFLMFVMSVDGVEVLEELKNDTEWMYCLMWVLKNVNVHLIRLWLISDEYMDEDKSNQNKGKNDTSEKSL